MEKGLRELAGIGRAEQRGELGELGSRRLRCIGHGGR